MFRRPEAGTYDDYDNRHADIMKQLTICGFDKELGKRLERLARKEGLSLNKAALLLLRRGAGLGVAQNQTDIVGDSLDHIIGSWSEEEEKNIPFSRAAGNLFFEQLSDVFH
ncbi:hypothetical protein MYX75_05455 [Acidobacteria bacterium AH-259-A15]|nr:hypothetical protein [Acidobacteria bacterium AH-259-A15]